MDRFWFWFGNVGVIATFLTAIPIFYGAWLYSTRDRRRKKVIEKIKQNPGNREAIFIIEMGDGTAEMQVCNWWLKEYGSLDIPVFTVLHEGYLKQEKLDKFLKEIKEKITFIKGQGTDKIHLFYAGSVIISAIVGCLLGNSCDVILYNRDQENKGSYENWGPLNRKFH